MKYDIVIAGVGGQGILTIARLLSMSAAARGLQVKQAEVHGMSQRGGAVYSHLRISDHTIHSDLIPAGQADLIISIEPLEALRYVSMLRRGGAIVASTNAEVNIPDYPRIEGVLDHVARYPHVAINMEKLARAAGSPLTANVVALGAASAFLQFSSNDYERAIELLFNRKGERIVKANLKAFRFGHSAGSAYLDAVQRGAEPSSIRGWIDTLSADNLSAEELEFSAFDDATDRLTGAESHAVESLLYKVFEDDRKQLYEFEVYRLLELVGAIAPPKHLFIPKGSTISLEALQGFSGDRVVVKLVSQDIVHKSDANAVAICPKSLEIVATEIDSMVARHTSSARVAGTLIVEFVEHDSRGLGGELFVGIRATREFGPVIAAGLGGLDTEYLASKLRAGVGVAKALATDIDAEAFLELFKKTVAYEVLSGQARGHERLVSDGELLRCFRAFISIARRFCIDRGEVGPDIGELEVNPFAFARQRLVPLDGRGQLRTAAKAMPARNRSLIEAFFEPRSIAIVGVSSQKDSFGRIILRNTLKQGFDSSRMFVVKPNAESIDGVRCVSSIAALPTAVDLLVIAAPSAAAAGLIREANECKKVRAVIVISGAAGETEGSGEVGEEIAASIREGRDDGGVVVLGPNCMGVRSLAGHYDTFFIPEEKFHSTTTPNAPLAFISQSGAFIISRLSEMRWLSPLISISLGNQCDVTVADLLWTLVERDDIRVAAVYLEGFANLDGLETIRALARWQELGKTVVFYKGGRSAVGRAAAAGHTAAVAGDYDICEAALKHAGVLVARSFREFGLLIDLASALAGVPLTGGSVFAVTNAGMEAVGVADTLGTQLSPLSEPFEIAIRRALANHKLDTLVTPRNPLDLTPMADETCYDAVISEALRRDEVGAIIVSCVPLAPQLRTLGSQLADERSFVSMVGKWRRARKPLVFVLDAGREYDELALAIRDEGVCVFRSADEAASCLAMWMDGAGARAEAKAEAGADVKALSVER